MLSNPLSSLSLNPAAPAAATTAAGATPADPPSDGFAQLLGRAQDHRTASSEGGAADASAPGLAAGAGSDASGNNDPIATAHGGPSASTGKAATPVHGQPGLLKAGGRHGKLGPDETARAAALPSSVPDGKDSASSTAQDPLSTGAAATPATDDAAGQFALLAPALPLPWNNAALLAAWGAAPLAAGAATPSAATLPAGSATDARGSSATDARAAVLAATDAPVAPTSGGLARHPARAPLAGNGADGASTQARDGDRQVSAAAALHDAQAADLSTDATAVPPGSAEPGDQPARAGALLGPVGSVARAAADATAAAASRVPASPSVIASGVAAAIRGVPGTTAQAAADSTDTPASRPLGSHIAAGALTTAGLAEADATGQPAAPDSRHVPVGGSAQAASFSADPARSRDAGGDGVDPTPPGGVPPTRPNGNPAAADPRSVTPLPAAVPGLPGTTAAAPQGLPSAAAADRSATLAPALFAGAPDTPQAPEAPPVSTSTRHLTPMPAAVAPLAGGDAALRSPGRAVPEKVEAAPDADQPTTALASAPPLPPANTAPASAALAASHAASAVVVSGLPRTASELTRAASAERSASRVAGADSPSGNPAANAGALGWLANAVGGAVPAGAPSNLASDGRLNATPGNPAFATELAAQVTTYARAGVQHARLELNPAEMGPLTVQIQLDGNAARVHLAAEHAGTRQALEQAMPQLAGTLRESGLTLSGGGVFEQARQTPQQQSAMGQGQGNGNGNGNGSGGRNGRTGKGDAAEAVTGLTSTVTARRQTGVVDLMA